MVMVFRLCGHQTAQSLLYVWHVYQTEGKCLFKIWLCRCLVESAFLTLQIFALITLSHVVCSCSVHMGAKISLELF